MDDGSADSEIGDRIFIGERIVDGESETGAEHHQGNLQCEGGDRARKNCTPKKRVVMAMGRSDGTLCFRYGLSVHVLGIGRGFVSAAGD